MKIKLTLRNKGLSLVGAIIVFGCLLILGYILLKILMRAADLIPPPVYIDPKETNQVTSVTSRQFESIMASENIVMPAFTFSEDDLEIMTVSEASTIVIERSTNLVNWEFGWRINVMDEFSFGSDTNQAPWCFYRAKFQ